MKDKTVADTTGYLPFDLMYVRDKFPGLNETVAARLAKMISRRRQLIWYRKDHTDVLQEEKAAVVDISKPEHKHLPSALKADVASEPAPSLKAPSQRTEVTRATTLRINAPMATLWPTNGLYAQSVSESGSSIASEQTANAITIRFPNRPMTEEGRVLEHYICPYCSTAQITTSERRWRKHVLSDLQPYICTYPDCELHDHFFENENDWFHHESHTHRVEWFCNTASHESFVDMQEFLDHMHTIHSEPLDQAQLLSLHRGFQRPSNAHSGTCTLCGKHASRLKSHLARHLEQLALFAIPQTDYMAALEEDDTSSNAARQGVASLSGSSTRGSIGTSSLRFSSQRSSRESDLGKPRTESGGLRLEAVAAASAVVSAVHGGSELLKQITRKRRTRKVRDQAQREWEEEQLQASLLEGEQQIALRWQQNQRELGDYAYSSELSYNFSGIDEAAPSDHTTMAKSRDVNEGPDTGYEGTRRNLLELSPPPSQTPPPSLRQRASRITSNILSPFRSRSKDGADFIARNVIEHTASFPGIPGEDWRNRNYNPFVKQPSRDINLDEENARYRIRSEAYLDLSTDEHRRLESSKAGEEIDMPDHHNTRPPLAPISRTSSDPRDAPLRPQTGDHPGNAPLDRNNIAEQRTWRKRLSKAVGRRSKSPMTMPTEQDVSPKIGRAIAHPALCSHSFKLRKSDTAMVLWNCHLCLAQNLPFVYECERCKLQKCQACTAKETRTVGDDV
ncbi:hypothetical protein B0T12DRAFT_485051 [Alternaria alternata]|nr:hypothetical protein B0T12DRAFT_485051 [Alternaria alternata]